MNSQCMMICIADGCVGKSTWMVGKHKAQYLTEFMGRLVYTLVNATLFYKMFCARLNLKPPKMMQAFRLGLTRPCRRPNVR